MRRLEWRLRHLGGDGSGVGRICEFVHVSCRGAGGWARLRVHARRWWRFEPAQITCGPPGPATRDPPRQGMSLGGGGTQLNNRGATPSNRRYPSHPTPSPPGSARRKIYTRRCHAHSPLPGSASVAASTLDPHPPPLRCHCTPRPPSTLRANPSAALEPPKPRSGRGCRGRAFPSPQEPVNDAGARAPGGGTDPTPIRPPLCLLPLSWTGFE